MCKSRNPAVIKNHIRLAENLLQKRHHTNLTKKVLTKRIYSLKNKLHASSIQAPW